MAITTNLPNNEVLISAFQPYYLEFSSSNAGATSANVEIRDINSVVITTVSLIPDNNEDFKYNLNSIVTNTLFDFDNYLESSYAFPDITTVANALFVDDTISKGYEIKIDIFASGSLIDSATISDPIYFLKASRQIFESPLMNDYSIIAPSGFEKPLTVLDFKTLVWQGYPIDVQFDYLDTATQSVLNDSGTILSSSLGTAQENRMLRLVLIDSDGNELTDLSTTSKYEVVSSVVSMIANIEYRVPICTPDKTKYVRFLNSNGGQSFWLFEDVHVIEKSIENRTKVQRNFNDISTARSRVVSMGTDVNDFLVVTQKTTSEEDNTYMWELLNSPVIEIWEGGNNWRRVSISNHSGSLTTKQVATTINITFDLGKIYNQSY